MQCNPHLRIVSGMKLQWTQFTLNNSSWTKDIRPKQSLIGCLLKNANLQVILTWNCQWPRCIPPGYPGLLGVLAPRLVAVVNPWELEPVIPLFMEELILVCHCPMNLMSKSVIHLHVQQVQLALLYYITETSKNQQAPSVSWKIITVPPGRLDDSWHGGSKKEEKKKHIFQVEFSLGRKGGMLLRLFTFDNSSYDKLSSSDRDRSREGGINRIWRRPAAEMAAKSAFLLWLATIG